MALCNTWQVTVLIQTVWLKVRFSNNRLHPNQHSIHTFQTSLATKKYMYVTIHKSTHSYFTFKLCRKLHINENSILMEQKSSHFTRKKIIRHIILRELLCTRITTLQMNAMHPYMGIPKQISSPLLLHKTFTKKV